MAERAGLPTRLQLDISTVTGGKSTWVWAQNSLVTVDAAAKTYRWNHDYKLLKHLTHAVDVGGRLLEASGPCDDVLAFANPNGSIPVLLRNELPNSQSVQVRAGARAVEVELPPDSIGTLTVKAA